MFFTPPVREVGLDPKGINNTGFWRLSSSHQARPLCLKNAGNLASVSHCSRLPPDTGTGPLPPFTFLKNPSHQLQSQWGVSLILAHGLPEWTHGIGSKSCASRRRSLGANFQVRHGLARGEFENQGLNLQNSACSSPTNRKPNLSHPLWRPRRPRRLQIDAGRTRGASDGRALSAGNIELELPPT